MPRSRFALPPKSHRILSGWMLVIGMTLPASAQTDVPVRPGDAVQNAGQSDRATTSPSDRGSDRGGDQPAESKGEALSFNFAGADWPSVLGWFAEQADLSLELSGVPAGTFTYVDPTRTYEVGEALDVVNLALLKRGFIAVRRGRLLQVIDVEMENSDKLISEIATLVTADQLDGFSRTEVLSCVFPLEGMTPEAAAEELNQLIGPWGRVVVLPSARQIKVTETAEKLTSIREVLEQTAAAKTEVTQITLEHRGAEEIIELARPLLGLEDGALSDDEIRISVGLLGDRMFVTGQPAKVQLLKNLVAEADKPLVDAADADEDTALPTFKTHPIQTADPTTVFDVLQTLLAGTPDARITIEPKTQSVIAFARPKTHGLITKTIAEMEGDGMELRVFDLRQLDPAQALLTINKFFGVDEEANGRGPIVDGNPDDGKLWVRGTPGQIELVSQLLDKLEGTGGGTFSERIRFFPVDSNTSDAVRRAVLMWSMTGRKNNIRMLPADESAPTMDQRSGISERMTPSRRPSRRGTPDAMPRRPANDPASEPDRPAPEAEDENPFEAASRASNPAAATWRLVAETDPVITPNGEPTAFQNDSTASQPDSNADSSRDASDNRPPADIILQMTPSGLMVASEDAEALDEFESLIEAMGSGGLTSDLPTIYWLQYAEAEPTAELISEILGGADSALGSIVDSATGSIGGGMLGGALSLLGGGGGEETSGAKSVLTAAGAVSIVPDARLNALIVQGAAADLALIDMLVEKIDVPDSPADVQIRSKPALIPVYYQDAEDVAKVVKETFGDRIAGQEKSDSGGGRGGSPSPQEFFAALRGGRGGGGGATAAKTKSEAPKINVAVDSKANALVVVATPQDFQEVRQLVEVLDEAGAELEETIETITVGGDVNPDVMKAALESILGTTVETKKADGSTSSASSSSAGGSSSSDTSADEIRRRIEAFRAFRERGGFGGGPGGSSGGSPFGGGRPGGFGGGRPGGGGGPRGGGR